MSLFGNKSLEHRRDGLLREAEHLEKRLKVIHAEITTLNSQIVPVWPNGGEVCRRPTLACDECGSTSIRCGCD